VELLVLCSSFGTNEYLKYPVFSARHKKTQVRIDILVLGLFYWKRRIEFLSLITEKQIQAVKIYDD